MPRNNLEAARAYLSGRKVYASEARVLLQLFDDPVRAGEMLAPELAASVVPDPPDPFG